MCVRIVFHVCTTTGTWKAICCLSFDLAGLFKILFLIYFFIHVNLPGLIVHDISPPVPHSGQNLVPASIMCPQFLHFISVVWDAPHSGQNFVPCSMLCSHFIHLLPPPDNDMPHELQNLC